VNHRTVVIRIKGIIKKRHRLPSSSNQKSTLLLGGLPLKFQSFFREPCRARNLMHFSFPLWRECDHRKSARACLNSARIFISVMLVAEGITCGLTIGPGSGIQYRASE
jgi:hypothetical protein